MKKTVNVGIGGRGFIIDEDAYNKLDGYLGKFREKTNMGYQTNEVMEDLEMRIAELFEQNLASKAEVVDIVLVNKVISQLGMPDGSSEDGMGATSSKTSGSLNNETVREPKRLYRDSDNNVIAGVCSGLGIYLNMDTVLVRILFILCFLFGTAGFWAYIIIWIAAPKAATAAQKCEMRGLPVTAENMRKFSKK